ncbi:tape measure protein [Mangrovicoccus ximenensis]|uniref:tape measure protein n=1 Tax=Mangrovicoccus ximenensis TaxID=1911570 RepID=UPI001374D035|nr:tape measure protein [Mangrovicoccus ximenensis]
MVTTALVALGSAAALVEFRNLAEGWRGVERSLTSIGQTGGDAQQQMVDLALRTRSEIGSTTAAVARMAKATGDDFGTTMRRVETLQKMMATGGASSAEVGSVGLQLGQALQSGVLSGDEFASIREAAPVEFLDALAAAAGVTRAELRAVAEAQELTSDIVLQALDGLAEQADASFAQLAVSGQEAVTVLRTGLTAYVGQLDQSLGTTEAVNGAMQWLGEYMSGAGTGAETLAASLQIVAGAAVGLAGGRGIGAVSSAFRDAAQARQDEVKAAQASVKSSKDEIRVMREKLDAANKYQRKVYQKAEAENRGTVITKKMERADRAQARAAENLAAAHARAAAATDRLAAAQTRLSLRTRVATGAMRAFSGVMAFFGGPVGAAITLAGALAIAISRIPSEAERVASSLSAAQSAASEFEAAMNDVARIDGEIAAAKEEMAQASATYKAAVAGEADVAAATARAEVDAINTRIGALNKLRAARLLAAQASALDAQSALSDIRGELMDQARDDIRRERALDNTTGTGPGPGGNYIADYEVRERAAERELAVRARIATGAGLEGLSAAEVEFARAAAEADAVQAKVELLSQTLEEARVGSIAGVTGATEAVVDTGNSVVTTILDNANLASRKIADLQAQAQTLRDALAGGGLDATQTREAEEALKGIGEQIDRLNGVKAPGGGSKGGKGKDPVQLISEEQVGTLDEARTLLNGLVQQTQTATEAQEAQAQRIAEARKLLVAAYGAESDQVAMLDEATKRLGQSGADAGAQLANTFAQVAMQAESVEDGIKQIIVQLLQMNGTSAFQSLFAGGGAGGFFSTLFTGAAPAVTASANGNIMTARGPLRLNRYAMGGIARSPQLSLFGEGRTPEAYVPLPDGRSIPVTLSMPAVPEMPVAGRGGGVAVQITNNVEVGSGSEADLAALERRMAAIGRSQADALVARLQREGVL